MKTGRSDLILGYSFGLFVLNVRELRLTHGCETVPAAPKVLETLRVLIERNGQVVSRADIIARVWPGVFVEEGSLAQNIFQLRRLLERDFQDPKPILTVPKRGYVFTPAVTVLTETEDARALPAEPLGTSLPVMLPAPQAPFLEEALAHVPSVPAPTPLAASVPLLYRIVARHRYLVSAGAVALTLLIILINHPSNSYARINGTKARPSISVLAFRNLEPSSQTDWESLALSDAISAELSANKQLQVQRPEVVAAAQRDQSISPLAVLSRAELDHLHEVTDSNFIVFGTYNDTATNLQLNLLVYDAGLGKTIASFSGTAAKGDEPSLLQGTVAHVRSLFDVDPNALEAGQLALATYQLDSDAARFYAEGVEKRRAGDLTGARQLLQRAIALSPRNPLLHLAMSEVWSLAGYDQNAAAEAKLSSRTSGQLPRERQLEIEARVHTTQYDWATAIKNYQSMVNLYPQEEDYSYLLAETLIASGHPAEALQALDRFMGQSGSRPPSARLLELRSTAFGAMADWKNALTVNELARNVAQKHGATLSVGRILVERADFLLQTGRFTEAQKASQDALALTQHTQDPLALARAELSYSRVLRAQSRLDEAKEAAEAGLGRATRAGDQKLVCEGLTSLGQIVRDHNDLLAAQTYFQRALDLSRSISNRHLEATALLNVANIQNNTGQSVAARATYEQADRASIAVGDRGLHNIVTGNLGNLDQAQGDLASAASRLQAAIAGNRAIGQQKSVAYELGHLVNVQQQLGHFAEAAKSLAERRTLLTSFGDQAGLLDCQMQSVELLVAQQQSDAALPEAERIARSAHSPGMLVRTSRVLVPIWLRLGRLREAAEYAARASASAHATVNQADYILPADLASAQVKINLGQTKDAEALLRSVQHRAHSLNLLPLELEARLQMNDLAFGREPRQRQIDLHDVKHAADDHGLHVLSLHAELKLRSTDGATNVALR